VSDELFIKRTADFSPCQTWRYTLKRVWDDDKPSVLFILLNPSTADEVQDDPTNRRGIGFAMDWGFGGVVFCNLFAVRTPDPKVMMRTEDPVGPMNNHWITQQSYSCPTIVLAWGSHGAFMGRDKEVLAMLQKSKKTLFCLGCTKGGHPKHILYLSRNVPWREFKP